MKQFFFILIFVIPITTALTIHAEEPYAYTYSETTGTTTRLLIDTSTLDSHNITITIPEHATLKETKPEGKLSTDGKTIAITYILDELTPSNVALIEYDVPKTPIILTLLVLLSICVLAGYLFYKKQTLSTQTANLLEEEKLIVETLHKHGDLWQKQLQNKTRLPKMKLSRKLRSLETKGVIEKIPYGNSNKIRLK